MKDSVLHMCGSSHALSKSFLFMHRYILHVHMNTIFRLLCISWRLRGDRWTDCSLFTVKTPEVSQEVSK